VEVKSTSRRDLPTHLANVIAFGLSVPIRKAVVSTNSIRMAQQVIGTSSAAASATVIPAGFVFTVRDTGTSVLCLWDAGKAFLTCLYEGFNAPVANDVHIGLFADEIPRLGLWL